MDKIDAEYIIGWETAPKTGRPHLQGYFRKALQIRFDTLKRGMPYGTSLRKAKGSTFQNVAYCSKDNVYWQVGLEDDYTPAVAKKGTKKKAKTELWDKMAAEIKAEYDSVIWKSWQDEVVQILATDPRKDRRNIYWYWEPDGGVGKSFLLKFVLTSYPGARVVAGKKEDIFHAIAKMKADDVIPTIIVVNVPKSGAKYVSYAALEGLKDGMLFSGKYEGDQCVFHSPHVIVMANSPPDENEWTKGRAVVKKIKPAEESVNDFLPECPDIVDLCSD